MAAKKDSKPYHHGDLHSALVEAALGLVKVGGVEALTLRGAARRAGVTHAAPYRHFEDKNALLAAVAQLGFEQMGESILEAQRACEDVGEELKATGLAYALFAEHNPQHFALMFGRMFTDREQYPGLQAASESTFALLLNTILRCQEAKVIVAEDPRTVALTAWSMTHGFASLIAEGQLQALGISGEQIASTLLQIQEIMYSGLGFKE